jgi:hypothetical protein
MTITLRHFPAGERGFFRAPVLLSGARQAILVDGGFTLEDGRGVAAAIRATGKQLTTIYVSFRGMWPKELRATLRRSATPDNT